MDQEKKAVKIVSKKMRRKTLPIPQAWLDKIVKNYHGTATAFIKEAIEEKMAKGWTPIEYVKIQRNDIKKLDSSEKHFVNGVFFCLHAEQIDEDQFWDLIREADFDKDVVENMILPFGNLTIRESIDRQL